MGWSSSFLIFVFSWTSPSSVWLAQSPAPWSQHPGSSAQSSPRLGLCRGFSSHSRAETRGRRAWQAGWFHHRHHGSIHPSGDQYTPHPPRFCPAESKAFCLGWSQGDFRQEKFIVISPEPLRPNRGLSQFAFSSTCMVPADIWADKQVCYTEPEQVSPCRLFACKIASELPALFNRGGLNSSLGRCGESQLPKELLTLCSFKRMKVQRAEMVWPRFTVITKQEKSSEY